MAFSNQNLLNDTIMAFRNTYLTLTFITLAILLYGLFQLKDDTLNRIRGTSTENVGRTFSNSGIHKQYVKVELQPVSVHMRSNSLDGRSDMDKGGMMRKGKVTLKIQRPTTKQKLPPPSQITPNGVTTSKPQETTRIMTPKPITITTSLTIKQLNINRNTTATATIKRPTTTTTATAIKSARPDSCKGCFQRPYPFIFNSPKVCQSPNNASIDLLILIFTTKSGRKRRDALRKTWTTPSANNTNPKFRYLFLVGSSNRNSEMKLREENDLHQDMAMQGFKDAYKNLTLKTMMGMEWHVKFCSQAKFVMKTDDDVYINVENLLNVTKRSDLKNKVFGYCQLTARPMRGWSKWAPTMLEYPGSTYPGYCSGTGYVMSGTIAEAIYRVSPHVPFFYLEDVYVSLCVDRLGYKLKFVGGFNPMFIGHTNEKCGQFGSKNFYTCHEVTPQIMIDIWNSCMIQ